MKTKNDLTTTLSGRVFFIVIAVIMLVRLVTLGLYPLMDSTESRYGEMARKMAAENNWITPMFDATQPFWGKPPLSFWTQAGSIKIFGVNEFAVRFPAWVMGVIALVILFYWVKNQQGTRTAWWSTLIFASGVLSFVASGTVMTDPALNLSVLIAMFGFWQGFHGRRRWGMLFFVGTGLGLLAKGPLILVLVGGSLFFWLSWRGGWLQLWQSFNWLLGTFITCAIALPWYVLAELKTPGFLEYFLLGEHWNRFMVSGWEGDRYGFAHDEPHGKIWLFLLVCLLPWALFLPQLVKELATKARSTISDWQAFLLCWAIFTPLFFTFSGNILATYVLPVMAPWSVLLANVIAKRPAKLWVFATCSLFAPVLLLGIVLEGSAFKTDKNQQPVIEAYQAMNQLLPAPIYYLDRKYSAEFYTQGQSLHIDNTQLAQLSPPYYLAVPEKDWSLLKENAWFIRCRQSTKANRTLLIYCKL